MHAAAKERAHFHEVSDDGTQSGAFTLAMKRPCTDASIADLKVQSLFGDGISKFIGDVVLSSGFPQLPHSKGDTAAKFK